MSWLKKLGKYYLYYNIIVGIPMSIIAIIAIMPLLKQGQGPILQLEQPARSVAQAPERDVQSEEIAKLEQKYSNAMAVNMLLIKRVFKDYFRFAIDCRAKKMVGAYSCNSQSHPPTVKLGISSEKKHGLAQSPNELFGYPVFFQIKDSKLLLYSYGKDEKSGGFDDNLDWQETLD